MGVLLTGPPVLTLLQHGRSFTNLTWVLANDREVTEAHTHAHTHVHTQVHLAAEVKGSLPEWTQTKRKQALFSVNSK